MTDIQNVRVQQYESMLIELDKMIMKELHNNGTLLTSMKEHRVVIVEELSIIRPRTTDTGNKNLHLYRNELQKILDINRGDFNKTPGDYDVLPKYRLLKLREEILNHMLGMNVPSEIYSIMNNLVDSNVRGQEGIAYSIVKARFCELLKKISTVFVREGIYPLQICE